MKLAAPTEGYLLPRIARVMRERASVIPSEMARRLGVSPPAVTQYEDPTTPLTEPTLRSYAAALGVPFERALVEGLFALQIRGMPVLDAAAPAPELHEDLVRGPAPQFPGGPIVETWREGKAAQRREYALRRTIRSTKRRSGTGGAGTVDLIYVLSRGDKAPPIETRKPAEASAPA